MTGTKTGGQKAAAKNLARDPLFYKKIGHKGGINGNTGGFAADNVIGHDGLTGPERAIICGAIGGRRSRRPKVNNTCLS